MAQWKRAQLVSMRTKVRSRASRSGLRIGLAVSCGVGCRCGLDPSWLWLWPWCRSAAAAPIQPLAWELPYATGLALKSKKRKGGREGGKKMQWENLRFAGWRDFLTVTGAPSWCFHLLASPKAGRSRDQACYRQLRKSVWAAWGRESGGTDRHGQRCCVWDRQPLCVSSLGPTPLAGSEVCPVHS